MQSLEQPSYVFTIALTFQWVGKGQILQGLVCRKKTNIFSNWSNPLSTKYFWDFSYISRLLIWVSSLLFLTFLSVWTLWQTYFPQLTVYESGMGNFKSHLMVENSLLIKWINFSFLSQVISCNLILKKHRALKNLVFSLTYSAAKKKKKWPKPFFFTFSFSLLYVLL